MEQRHDDEIVRHEEELRVAVEEERAGALRLRTRTDVEHVTELAERVVEDAELERAEPSAADSGEIETLPDGSISVPLFEEQLVVTKRLVVRERVIVRKRTRTEEQRVEAELRRERLDVDVEGDVAEVEGDPG